MSKKPLQHQISYWGPEEDTLESSQSPFSPLPHPAILCYVTTPRPCLFCYSRTSNGLIEISFIPSPFPSFAEFGSLTGFWLWECAIHAHLPSSPNSSLFIDAAAAKAIHQQPGPNPNSRLLPDRILILGAKGIRVSIALSSLLSALYPGHK